MEHYIKTILRNIYLQYGDSVFTDPRRLIAFMEDALVDYPIEKKRLSIVVNENIVNQLIYEKENDILSKAFMYINTLNATYEIPKATSFDLINAFYYAVYGSEMKTQGNDVFVTVQKTPVQKKKSSSINIEMVLDEVRSHPTASRYNENIIVIQEAAQNNSAEAQFLLGKMYQYGIGVTVNIIEAKKWYMLSAAQNHGAALNNLGVIYQDEKKELDAINAYRRSLNTGEILAAYNLGTIYSNMAKKHSEIYEKLDNYLLALKYVQKGVDIDVPPPYTKHAEFLKIKFELSKKGVFLCKNIRALLSKNININRDLEESNFYAREFDFLKHIEEISKKANEMYNIDINSVKW